MWFVTLSVLKAVDDHCGYAIPWDPFQFVTGQNALFHDIHHQGWGIKVSLRNIAFLFVRRDWTLPPIVLLRGDIADYAGYYFTPGMLSRQISRRRTLHSGIMRLARRGKGAWPIWRPGMNGAWMWASNGDNGVGKIHMEEMIARESSKILGLRRSTG